MVIALNSQQGFWFQSHRVSPRSTRGGCGVGYGGIFLWARLLNLLSTPIFKCKIYILFDLCHLYFQVKVG